MTCPLCGGTGTFVGHVCARCLGARVVPDAESPQPRRPPPPPPPKPFKPPPPSGGPKPTTSTWWGGKPGKPPPPPPASKGGGWGGALAFFGLLALIGALGQESDSPAPSYYPPSSADLFGPEYSPAPEPAAPDPVVEELAALQGLWETTEPESLAVGGVIVRYRQKHALYVEGERAIRGLMSCSPLKPLNRVAISPDRTPKLWSLTDPGAVADTIEPSLHNLFGIYDLSGSRLVVAGAFFGHARPRTFEKARGTRILTYERVAGFARPLQDRSSYVCGIHAWNDWQRLGGYLRQADGISTRVSRLVADTFEADAAIRLLRQETETVSGLRQSLAQVLTGDSDTDLRLYAAELLSLFDAMRTLYGEGARFYAKMQGYVGTVPEDTLRVWVAEWAPTMDELDGNRAALRQRVAEQEQSLGRLLSARYGREFAPARPPQSE